MNVQTIGPHRLVVGDIHNDPVSLVMGDEKADLIYTDPPWGPGLLQMFATMNERGSVPAMGWMAFLDSVAAICAQHRAPGAPVFVEMGCRWTQDLDERMSAHHLPLQRRWEVTYGSDRRPSTLVLYGEKSISLQMPVPPHGEAVTGAVLGALVRPGTIVLDPFTGLGMTARITHKLGGYFRGTELNPKRMERTVKWLRSKYR